MSLRDLSREAGISMGGIYSCIGKKDDIVIIVYDVVRQSSQYVQKCSILADSCFEQIQQSILYHLHASTILQPWYFFLYFETRSLPSELQQASMDIEVSAIDSFYSIINNGIKAGEFHTRNAEMVANIITVMLEDWYVKPLKNACTKQAKKNKSTDKTDLQTYYEDIDNIT